MEELVSVVVVTYNAEKTIIDALESIFSQSYKAIELVISDDGSTDSTIRTCKKWCEKKRSRFNNVIIIESPNTGVAINLNRGLKACSGIWIKEISGDDILLPDAIQNGLEYMYQNNITTLCCFKSVDFYKNKLGKNVFTRINPDYYTEYVLGKDVSKQYRTMLREYVIAPSSTAIIKREFHEKVGYYDDTFPFIEDYPFNLKISKMGHKIHYCSTIATYGHRINMESTNQSEKFVMNPRTFGVNGILTMQDKKYVLPNIRESDLIFRYHYLINIFRRYIVVDILHGRKNGFILALNKVLYMLDPFALKRKIVNRFKNAENSEINKSLLLDLNVNNKYD